MFAPLDAVFFRPLICPEITLLVPGLSLVERYICKNTQVVCALLRQDQGPLNCFVMPTQWPDINLKTPISYKSPPINASCEATNSRLTGCNWDRAQLKRRQFASCEVAICNLRGGDFQPIQFLYDFPLSAQLFFYWTQNCKKMSFFCIVMCVKIVQRFFFFFFSYFFVGNIFWLPCCPCKTNSCY